MKTKTFQSKIHKYKASKYFSDEIHFRKACVLLVLVEINNSYHIVFEKRSASISQANEICFPGGMYDEQDAHYEETALRECEEELGVNREDLQVVTSLNPTISSSGTIIYAYLAILHHYKGSFNFNTEEVESVFTLPLSYFIDTQVQTYYVTYKAHPYVELDGVVHTTFPAQELGLPDTYQEPWGNYKSQVYVYPSAYGLIWGLTAKILFDFIHDFKSL